MTSKNTPKKRANIFTILPLAALAVFPKSSFADINKSLFDILNKGPEAKNISIKDFPSSESDKTYENLDGLDYGIPPKLKKLYKKLSSVSTPQDIFDIQLTAWEMYFFREGEFMNENRVLTKQGMKVVKQMVLTMTNLDEEDMVMLAEEYRKSHPDDNHSQEEVEILALGITAQRFNVKLKSGPNSFNVNPYFEANWYLVKYKKGSLMMCKPIGPDKNGIMQYESWSLCESDGKGKTKRTPIRIALNHEGRYVVENMNGYQINGHCAIGKDGNLYATDASGNIFLPNGGKDTINYNPHTGKSDLNKDVFISFWDYSISGIESNASNSPTLFLDISGKSDNMIAEKCKSKENTFLVTFKGSEYYKQGYNLTVDQKNNTFVLKKDGFSSHNSPYMLNMDSDEFDDWVLSAKTSIDQQIEKKDLEIERLQNKESVFLTFVNTFCVPSGEGDGMYILSLAKIKASEYSIYYDFSNFYDFTGRYAIKKGEGFNEVREGASFSLIDLWTGEELMDYRNPMSRLSNKEGNKSSWGEIISYPVRYIKRHENQISYEKFLDIIAPQNGDEKDYGVYMSFGILYDGFLIRPDIGYSYEERDYKIDISPKTGSSTDSKTIKINKDMTGEQIKIRVDNAIHDLNQ